MMHNIFIIGTGAIGKALAVSLALNNQKVILLRGSVDDQQPYTENIQLVLGDETTLEATVEVNTLSNYPVLDGLVVLTNKSFGNTSLAQTLRGKIQEAPLVVLQNGLGVEQPFLDQDFPSIYRCVLFVTSQFTEENKLSFKPVAVSPIGIIKGNAARLPAIAAALSTPHFPFRVETDIQPVIWKKAIANSVFNSICPLLEVDNGIFHRDTRVLAMAQNVIAECVAIANDQGVPLTVEEVVESVLLISRLSDGQLISTLQDIRHKRPTEIDTLNFAIVKIARSLHKEHTLPATRLLGELTKLKSDINR